MNKKKQSKEPLAKVISRNIRRFRKSKGYTQTELAEAIGVDISTMSRYERNAREPSITQLQAIAEALEIPAALLLETNDKDVLAISMVEVISKLSSRDMELAVSLVRQVAIHRGKGS